MFEHKVHRQLVTRFNVLGPVTEINHRAGEAAEKVDKQLHKLGKQYKKFLEQAEMW